MKEKIYNSVESLPLSMGNGILIGSIYICENLSEYKGQLCFSGPLKTYCRVIIQELAQFLAFNASFIMSICNVVRYMLPHF